MCPLRNFFKVNGSPAAGWLLALETVLDYYWNEESRSYEETPEEDPTTTSLTRG